MAMDYKKLFEPTLLSAAAATILTIPSASPSTLLKGCIVRLTNTSGAAVPATLYSGTGSATNNFFPGKSIPANDFVDVQVPQMKAGDLLQGFAGTANVVNIQPLSGAYYAN